ncbi:ABC transporter ATP-binding protein [Sinomonas atrocyanea]|uniref:ABC transporter ATP-binding protein n=1 Tax=Sinomonas atrocyanea TaxID=37927 RepID=UPI00082C29E5|nr:ABC transporter ATP-binding protein [Sinomonas atrocyanea]GEB62684.1 ABC transporter ATP-binding protein [Sinomonas atrocyanea]GGG54130.1 ABC transporter ATP-binding protein [Sinomonas atrocyanea]
MLQTGTPCLEIEGLVKDVGPLPSLEGRMKRVLAGVDLTANAGEITVILGVNGAGKTTTLECAQGLQRRTAGVVRLLGEDPEKADAALRARVGIMLQEGGLPPAARPLALLAHVAGMYADPRPVGELAERLGIHEFASTTIRRLSGGQKQRVALAAALIGRPEVVFLDEPSAGLDPQSRQLVVDLIDELRRDGLGVILTTHLLDDAERLADVVHILDRGRVVTSGTVGEILARREGTRSRLTLRSRPGLDLAAAFADRAAEGVTVTEASAGHYTVDGELTPADLLAVAQWLHARDIMPHSLELGTANLQDVFLSIAAESAAEDEAARRDGRAA